jgi:carbon storage regulator
MLVLTRKVGEKLLIGDDITISVIEVNRGGVRIGVEAPRNVSILRHEVYERIQEENLTASRAASAMNIQQAADLWRNKGPAKGDKGVGE